MNLYEKINTIMQNVESLKKDGKVEFGSTKYKYLSEAKTTAEIRKQLIEQKLVILPIEVTEQKEGQITHGLYTYKLVNVENPDEFITLQSGGQGHDSSDKGSGKASSYAYKYLMWRTFAIPSNDHPDQVLSDENVAKSNPLASELISDDEIGTLLDEIKRTGADKEKLLAYYKVKDLESMTMSDFYKCIKALEKKSTIKTNTGIK